MKRFLTLVLTFIFLNASAQEYYMIVGTYDSPKSEGIYVFRFNATTGIAREVSHIKTPNPSFVALSPDEKYVYAVHEIAPQDGKGGDIAAFAFDKSSGRLTFINQQLSGGDHPCHVEVDHTGKWLFASNYSSGTLSMLPILPGGGVGPAQTWRHEGKGPNTERQKGPHVHGAVISKDNRQLLVTDLGIDKTVVYDFDATSGTLKNTSNVFAPSEPGSGPRLITFHPNRTYAYLIEELSGSVVVYRYEKSMLERIQRISTMPAGDKQFAGSADVHVSPDGKFLYASNRGESNTIAIYRIRKKGAQLQLVAHQSTLGKTPRNFSIDPTGNYLLCENQNSDEIVVFRRNRKTGLLTDMGNRISVGKPVCIKWAAVETPVP